MVAFLFSGEHSWLFSEPDPGVEVPVTNPGGQVDGTLLQGALPGKTTAWDQWMALQVHCRAVTNDYLDN